MSQRYNEEKALLLVEEGSVCTSSEGQNFQGAVNCPPGNPKHKRRVSQQLHDGDSLKCVMFGMAIFIMGAMIIGAIVVGVLAMQKLTNQSNPDEIPDDGLHRLNGSGYSYYGGSGNGGGYYNYGQQPYYNYGGSGNGGGYYNYGQQPYYNYGGNGNGGGYYNYGQQPYYNYGGNGYS